MNPMEEEEQGITGEEAEELIRSVRRNPSFVAFSRMIHDAIATGHAVAALEMLTGIGARAELASAIIENWPMEDGDCVFGGSMFKITPDEERALRLASMIDDINEYDWGYIVGQNAGEHIDLLELGTD